ncbi:hypothetical protein TNCV_63951 [Trichonephila clavipes]|nr:hypothetical protein TNCV_63951 [Trichonephila clavipes]
MSYRGPRNSSWQMVRCTPVVSRSFGQHSGDRLVARRLFRAPHPRRKGTTNLKTPMLSPGFEVAAVAEFSCHEFEPSTTKDPPCRAAMHVKSVELKRPPVGVVW